MSTILVNVIGLIVIILVIWWFMIAKPKAIKVTGNRIEIRVHDGVYEPAVIKAKKGQTLHLQFFRQDDTPCSEVVIFEKLNISATLPFNKRYDLSIPLKKSGEFDFTCQMGMYRGKLIVE